MRRAWVVLWSVVAATAIVAFSFATADDLLGGAGAAARNSARFSAFLFAVALAARAGRPPQLGAHQIELTLGFVAAHAIHYGTVLARAAIDPANALRQPSLDALVVVAGGVGLLALVGLTARAHSTSASRAHAIAFYIVGAIFAAAEKSDISSGFSSPACKALFTAHSRRATSGR